MHSDIMKNDNVTNVTISFSKEEKKIFDELCEEETHGSSAQVKHMMKFYLKYKDKVK